MDPIHILEVCSFYPTSNNVWIGFGAVQRFTYVLRSTIKKVRVKLQDTIHPTMYVCYVC